MRKDRNLNHVIAALSNSGYSDMELESAEPVNITDGGSVVFKVTYEDPDGQPETGNVYLQYRDGKWYGDF